MLRPIVIVDPREDDVLPRPHFTESYEVGFHGNRSQTPNHVIAGRQTVITDTRQAYENTGKVIVGVNLIIIEFSEGH